MFLHLKNQWWLTRTNNLEGIMNAGQVTCVKFYINNNADRSDDNPTFSCSVRVVFKNDSLKINPNDNIRSRVIFAATFINCLLNYP